MPLLTTKKLHQSSDLVKQTSVSKKKTFRETIEDGILKRVEYSAYRLTESKPEKKVIPSGKTAFMRVPQFEKFN
jgi:hypothetical protein